MTSGERRDRYPIETVETERTREEGRPIRLPASRVRLSPLDTRPTTQIRLSVRERFANRMWSVEGLP
jgi:hypothetical protein